MLSCFPCTNKIDFVSLCLFFIYTCIFSYPYLHYFEVLHFPFVLALVCIILIIFLFQYIGHLCLCSVVQSAADCHFTVNVKQSVSRIECINASVFFVVFYIVISLDYIVFCIGYSFNVLC